MRRGAALALGVPLLAAACGHRALPPPVPRPRYTVGEPYQAGGVWRYPQESFDYRATGLAGALSRGAGLTADGERYDPEAMAAAHPTVQLPAVARVTNLDTGRQAVVRLNDRGPADPGRLIALTPRAAALLGIPPGGAVRVRVQVEADPSEALRDSLGDAPKATAAAPAGTVTAESLPPPGAPAAHGQVEVIGEPRPAQAAPAPPPARLPAAAVQVAAQPGGLWLDLGEFHGAAYAGQRRARLAGVGAQVEREGHGRSTLYRVRAGPFGSVAAADAALDQARRAGVSDAAITAE